LDSVGYVAVFFFVFKFMTQYVDNVKLLML
jgi:hypothetical protein